MMVTQLTRADDILSQNPIRDILGPSLPVTGLSAQDPGWSYPPPASHILYNNDVPVSPLLELILRAPKQPSITLNVQLNNSSVRVKILHDRPHADPKIMAKTEGTIAYVSAAFIPLREPVVRRMIKVLQFPPGSHGLDVGCGTGHPATLLAESVGPSGHVTGLDLSPEILVHAHNYVDSTGLVEQITFKEGNAAELPFADNTFDWAWSMDCVGYLPFEQLRMLGEMARVVRPGGIVAILAWTSEKLLPGYPLLEARLSATTAGIAPFSKGMKPKLHFMRALDWFRKVDLIEATAHTFSGDAHAPLTSDLRQALESLFLMRWPGVEAELSEEDWGEYQRLCLPESADFILNQPDYYAFFTYSLFHGRVVAQTF